MRRWLGEKASFLRVSAGTSPPVMDCYEVRAAWVGLDGSASKVVLFLMVPILILKKNTRKK